VSEPALPLEELASQINAEHRAFIAGFRRTLEHGIEAGRLLSEAKARCRHGEWLVWLAANVEVAPRTAQEYVRLYKHRDELRAKTRSAAHLTAKDALKMLARPAPRSEDLQGVLPYEPDSPAEDRYELRLGDFRECLSDIPDGAVDLIFTDPPYSQDAAHLWSDLGALAARVLKPGGFLIAYSGQSTLAEAFSRIGAHRLRPYWVFSVSHTRAHARLWGYGILNAWKPLPVWRKDGGIPQQPRLWIVDELRIGELEAKTHHEWAQPVGQASALIAHFTQPGELILDPMMGSGTTVLAAVMEGRKGVGCEIEEEAYLEAKRRIVQL